jgi:tetratricopeptide (TPR) repeat protein
MQPLTIKTTLQLLISLLVSTQGCFAADTSTPPLEEMSSSADSESIKKRSAIPISSRDFLDMIKKSTLVLEKDPKNAGAYLDLGYANRNLGNYKKDLEYCNKSIELDPNVAVAYGERALAYSGLDNYEKALADISQAIKLDENNSAFYSHRAWVFVHQKKFAEAVKECTRSIEIYADYSPAFYCRGRAYLELGQYQNAIADFTQAIKLFPNVLEGYYKSRAFAYMQLKQFPQALNDLLISLRIAPDDDVAFLYKGIALSKSGAQQDALNDLDKAIKLNPKNVSALSNRGILYRLAREFTKSLADLDAAIAVTPDSGILHRERGLTYLAMNEPEKAEADFTRASALDPDDYDSAYQLAYVKLRGKGDFKLAYDNSKDKTVVVATKTKNVTFFLDTFPGTVTEQKAILAEIVKKVETFSPTEHLPESDNFRPFLERDLTKYFRAKSAKPGQVEFELLRDVPTLTVSGKPAFYCWVKLKKGDEIIEEGPVRLEVADKKLFSVIDYLPVTTISADPTTVLKAFPAKIAVDILYRAKVKSTDIPELTKQITPSS